MEDSDNIMNILKSITPIKEIYSKRKKAMDNSFKHMSLQRIIKNMNYHPKIIDEFSPAPEFLKQENKYHINFKKSNAYIKELSDLSKLPLISNKKNLDKKKLGEEKKRKKEILNERYKKLYNFKKSNSSVDSLIYNPNYDFIKKKIYCVHIRPPPIVTIRKHNKEYEKNIDTKKNKDEKNITEQQYALEKKQNKSQDDNELNKNNKQNNFIVFNTNTQNNNNSSKANNKSYPNLSKSSKNHNNFNYNKRNSTRNSLKSNQKLISLKSPSNKNNDKRYSLSNSECYTLEINKSTNIENISHIYRDKEKINSSNSTRNISNKNVKFPKANTFKIKIKRKNTFKNYLSFKKMRGRYDYNTEEKDNHIIAYEPNYKFFWPHIHSTFFSYKNDDENYKKYKTGKIIRGYNYSPDDYFVCEFKKKKTIKFDMNREKLKIIEMLRKKFE